MRKFIVKTANGLEIVAQLQDSTAREIARRNECLVHHMKEEESHKNPVMR